MSAPRSLHRGHTPDNTSPASQAAVIKLWQQANAVCFDVDCTITKQDALDDLADFLGKGDAVKEITNAAMNGTLDLDDALQKRVEIMEPTVEKLRTYVESNPAQARLAPGAKALIEDLQARKVHVYLISGGFRELILPVADYLNIPRENIFANRFVYMADDDNEIRVTSFDRSQPTSKTRGKPEAIRRIRAMKPFQTIVMVGDGITDLEAVQETGGADLFIGYGGIVQRKVVQEGADWFVTDFQELIDALPRLKVAMIGSGAFASAVMQMISLNAQTKRMFQDRVDMYVYEEEYQGGKLTEAINQKHENPKYMPGVKFGSNVVANPSLKDTAKDADLLIFCAPHQFMLGICKQLQVVVKPTAIAISLTKGIHISPTGPQLISSMIRHLLGLDCSVMMGANLAGEIRPGGLCEATIGVRSVEHGEIFSQLFDTPYFTTSVINDVEGAELAGALKNVVALGAGFCDGCGLGENAKAAIMRQGLNEMRWFAKEMYPTVRDETFFESCGVADLIATCYGGRNHRVATEYAKWNGTRSFEQLEAEMLNGQKLQGVLTTEEVQTVLHSRGCEQQYPLFTAVYAIVVGAYEPTDIVRYREIAKSPTLIVPKNKKRPEELNRKSLLEIKIGL